MWLVRSALSNFLHQVHGFLMPTKIYFTDISSPYGPKNLEAVVEVEALGSNDDNDGNDAIDG